MSRININTAKRGINIAARRKRLLVLADFLENQVLPRLDGAKFDMGEWGRTTEVSRKRQWWGSEAVRAPLPANIEGTSECGFVGCAAGWAGYSPSLVKAGIRDAVWFSVQDGIVNVSEDALAEFFGLDVPADFDPLFSWWQAGDEFERCFMPAKRGPTTGVKGIKLVVERLREVANAKVETAKATHL
jgi:hypothetical protein